MIIVDTNVVSEALKLRCDPGVLSWLDAQPAETLFFASTSYSEILTGIAVLPVGKRRNAIHKAMQELLSTLFADRILPFEQNAAVVYSELISATRAKGKAISMADGQIGAVAHAHGFSVATRDTAPFLAMGLQVINPFSLR